MNAKEREALRKEREALRDAICEEVSCNVFGRLEHIAKLAEERRNDDVRRELLALLKFYPGRPRK